MTRAFRFGGVHCSFLRRHGDEGGGNRCHLFSSSSSSSSMCVWCVLRLIVVKGNPKRFFLSSSFCVGVFLDNYLTRREREVNETREVRVKKVVFAPENKGGGVTKAKGKILM